MKLLGLLFTFSIVSCSSHRTESPSPAQPLSSIGIIGGQETKAQEFPFIVNIWLNSPQDLFVDHLCGGSLIHKNWVLTAAHCILQDVTDPSQGVVRLKDLTLFIAGLKRAGQDAQKATAKKILVHPKFSWPHFDVALIELNESIENIKPASINTTPLQDFSKSPSAIVAGWGLTDSEGQQDAPTLRHISLPLVSRSQCESDDYVRNKHWSIGADMVCAQTDQGLHASCHGDSGGPLFQKVNGDFLQIGIVSWGSACNPSFRDRQSNIEGYADVSAASSWILEQLQSSSPK